MNPSAILEEVVSIPLGARTLEGVLAYPESDAPGLGILLLSPHPHMGGRMDNNVIEHLARRFAEEGCATLRFNYGGTGQSELEIPEGQSTYEYWADIEATKAYDAVLPDALAARTCLADELPPGVPLAYIGYSFGACLATLLAQVHPPVGLAAISPPLREAPLVGLENLTIPACFVAGDKDFVFDHERMQRAIRAMPRPAVFVELAGCDHFYRKQEERVYQAIRPTVIGAVEAMGGIP